MKTNKQVPGKPSKELSIIELGDKRLSERLEKTVESMTQKPEESILGACGTRHDAKAFYALSSNENFTKEKLQAAAQNATIERMSASGLREVLLVQDTTDINLGGHKKTEGLGLSGNQYAKGIQVHSCIGVAPNGVPIGFVTQQYHTRTAEKSPLTKNQKQSLPLEEKESYRWLKTTQESLEVVPKSITPIVICDREGDFYELYEELQSIEASFIIRVAQNRVTSDGQKVLSQLRQTKACGEVEVSIPRDTRKNRPARTAKMEVAYCTMTINKPKNVRKKSAASLTLTFVRITEIGDITHEPIEWVLATNMSATNADEALKAVTYYVHRWKIERFHYVLKSGCQVEKIQQRTYERILPLLTIYSVIALYILSMTYVSRLNPETPCDTFLDEEEWTILYMIVNKSKSVPKAPYSLKLAIEYLGQLGSFKHSPSDGDYGVKAIWKGLARLFDSMPLARVLMGQV